MTSFMVASTRLTLLFNIFFPLCLWILQYPAQSRIDVYLVHYAFLSYSFLVSVLLPLFLFYSFLISKRDCIIAIIYIFFSADQQQLFYLSYFKIVALVGCGCYAWAEVSFYSCILLFLKNFEEEKNNWKDKW